MPCTSLQKERWSYRYTHLHVDMTAADFDLVLFFMFFKLIAENSCYEKASSTNVYHVVSLCLCLSLYMLKKVTSIKTFSQKKNEKREFINKNALITLFENSSFCLLRNSLWTALPTCIVMGKRPNGKLNMPLSIIKIIFTSCSKTNFKYSIQLYIHKYNYDGTHDCIFFLKKNQKLN